MSIRTYIFTLLTGLVLLIAVGLSFQSARFFIDSFGMVIENVMFSIGQQYPEPGKTEQKVLRYHVTTDWDKVPQQVRNYFPTIPEEKNELHTKFIDWIYIQPPKKVYSLIVVEREDKTVFVSHYNENVHAQHEGEQPKDNFLIDPMILIILVGLSVLAIFILVLLYIFKKIALPVESLQQWAKNLKISELNKPCPDFTFKELNGLANLIHENLTSVASSVEREQEFLSYASHELRTPIAVIRSNTALLEKISPAPSDKERQVRDRIQRASLTMKSMTETLLWLSREGKIEMAIESANLGQLVKNTQSELAYLLAGKKVTVNIEVDDSQLSLAVTPSIIVLNNLIRNAFQHTQQGHVDIIQQGCEVTISNVESAQINPKSQKDELGFGLGMKLVEKLTAQFSWPYQITDTDKGYRVAVCFLPDKLLTTQTIKPE
ncbi:HAMP domain-containing histidine kinase [Thalassomonas viridans]|uniref:histidine kinase n=1 Tax=Thalassomonas viridans TaxID=137584 RepID=A0AAE9Z5Y5_9GAMM|nr:HAMP domain-containing sensor histidine kinase [Thalassomonas viridans]WDE05858.1 HAMP domain-containing histidine kinase [Thalassomonas viridans]